MNSILLKRYFFVTLILIALTIFAVVAYLRRPRADVAGTGPAAPSVIWGHVTDTGGKPLAGIVVTLGSKGTVTGPQGGYVLVTDTTGAQAVYFKHQESHDIYHETPSEEAIIVSSGQSTNYDFVIARLDIQPTPITAVADISTSPTPITSSAPLPTVSPSATPAPKPAQPTNLTAVAKQNPRRVELKWKENATNETGFTVVRTEAKTALVKFFEVPANTTTYNDTTAEKGKTYFYKVRAFSGSGSTKSYSTYSNERKVSVK